jgi:TP901 family phage tail tape measure protein
MAIKPVEILIKARDEASGIFGLLRRNAVELGATIAGVFGIRLFTDAVQGAAELEAKLSEVRAVAGGTAEDMQLLRKAAEDAGATTKFSATEGADALGNLARAGLNAQQAITALPATLQLAQAGQLGLAESAEIVTRTIAGFNLQATDAGRIADVLAQGANASNTSVVGLGQALSYAAPTAVSLGLSLETTVAIIGKFADAGIDASRAGTALNAVLSQFSDPASRFRQELAAMGITTTDFETALRQMANAGPASQKAVLAVGTEAGPALRALLNQGIGALDDLKGRLVDSGGSAAAFAATVENNLNGSLSGLASAWDTVKNALATPVLPVLKDGAERLTAVLREAVENGTVGKFGDAIARGFQTALEWGQRFAAQVDVEALAARIGGAADQVGATFTALADYARNAGASVQTAWGVMTAGANTVLTVIYTVGSAFATMAQGVATGVALLREGLASVSFGGLSAGFAEAAQDARDSAGAFGAAADALGQKAAQSLAAVADGAQQARNGWAALTEDTQAAAQQASTGTAAFDSMSQSLTAVGTAAATAGQATRAELEQTATTAKATAAEVAGAFERMGVQSKDQLAQAAANAQRDFELIKASGQATTEGLALAFKTYAEAAIAANNGVATESLQAEAAMRGLEVAADAAGKTVVRSFAGGEQVTAGLTRGVREATAAIQEHIGWLDRLEARNKAVQSSLQKDSEGFATNTAGDRVVAGGNLTTLTGISKFLQDAGLDEGQAKRVAQEFSDGKGNIPYFSNPGQIKYGGRSSTISEALLKAAERTTFGSGSEGGGGAIGRTVQVNINTGRGQETVNTDEAGAQALVRTLQTAGLSSRG